MLWIGRGLYGHELSRLPDLSALALVSVQNAGILSVFVCVYVRLYQVKMEKEQYQTEIRDLQEQLSEMHDELDGAKQSQIDSADKEAMMEVQH